MDNNSNKPPLPYDLNKGFSIENKYAFVNNKTIINIPKITITDRKSLSNNNSIKIININKSENWINNPPLVLIQPNININSSVKPTVSNSSISIKPIFSCKRKSLDIIQNQVFITKPT